MKKRANGKKEGINAAQYVKEKENKSLVKKLVTRDWRG
jgi:hypothetical protein